MMQNSDGELSETQSLLLPRNGIDCHSLFIAEIHFLPSKSSSELTISP